MKMKTTISIIAIACLCACAAPTQQPRTANPAPNEPPTHLVFGKNLSKEMLTESELAILYHGFNSFSDRELLAAAKHITPILLGPVMENKRREELTTADKNTVAFAIFLSTALKKRGIWDDDLHWDRLWDLWP